MFVIRVGTLVTRARHCVRILEELTSAVRFYLVRFRVIVETLTVNEQIPGGTEPKKYGETRYGSRVTMSERMINTKRIYEKLMLGDTVDIYSFSGHTVDIYF